MEAETILGIFFFICDSLPEVKVTYKPSLTLWNHAFAEKSL